MHWSPFEMVLEERELDQWSIKHLGEEKVHEPMGTTLEGGGGGLGVICRLVE